MLGDVGYLRPHQNAVFVAQVIEFLGMLIVGQTDGVGADFPDECHILPMLLDAQCIAQSLPVLVTADTPQGIYPAIEEEALVRIKLDGAAAELGGNLIAAVQHGLGGVEIGIRNAVP